MAYEPAGLDPVVYKGEITKLILQGLHKTPWAWGIHEIYSMSCENYCVYSMTVLTYSFAVIIIWCTAGVEQYSIQCSKCWYSSEFRQQQWQDISVPGAIRLQVRPICTLVYYIDRQYNTTNPIELYVFTWYMDYCYVRACDTVCTCVRVSAFVPACVCVSVCE